MLEIGEVSRYSIKWINSAGLGVSFGVVPCGRRLKASALEFSVPFLYWIVYE